MPPMPGPPFCFSRGSPDSAFLESKICSEFARAPAVWIVGCIAGSVIYRLAVALALNAAFLGLNASDLNLVTAVLVAVALILPGARNPLRAAIARRLDARRGRR